MRALRVFKTEVALLMALADLGGVWPVHDRDRGADRMRRRGARGAVALPVPRPRRAKASGSAPTTRQPEASSGYIVLAMGKHGAGELNYSSDIDLIVFYDRDRMRAAPAASSRRPSSCA